MRLAGARPVTLRRGRPAVGAQGDDRDAGGKQRLGTAQHGLVQDQPGGAGGHGGGGDAQQIVEPGGRQILRRDPPDGQHDPRPGLQPDLVEAKLARPFAAAPFDEFQIVGVIDDARQIGVLVIDAQVEVMGHRARMHRARAGGKGAEIRAGCRRPLNPTGQGPKTPRRRAATAPGRHRSGDPPRPGPARRFERVKPCHARLPPCLLLRRNILGGVRGAKRPPAGIGQATGPGAVGVRTPRPECCSG